MEDVALRDAQRKIGELSMQVDILNALLERKGGPPSPRRSKRCEQLPAPLKKVCRVAGVSRSAACEARRQRGTSEPPRRRPGPIGAMTDTELLAQIRGVLADSPFVGEGHRKVWARLRRERGVYTSRKRVLRLTREAGLLAPDRARSTIRRARRSSGTGWNSPRPTRRGESRPTCSSARCRTPGAFAGCSASR